MEEGSLKLVMVEKANEAAEQVKLGDEARARLDPEVGVRAYITRLANSGLWPAALTFLAHVLPKREAVWWACKCVRLSAGPPPTIVMADAVSAAENWVIEPTEEYRRAAEEMAKRAGVGTPAGLVAMSAFWSSGSLAPAGLPEVPPGGTFTARGVSGAIIMACVRAEPESAPERYKRYLDLGLAIAEGSDVPPSPSLPPRGAIVSPAPRRKPGRIADTWE